MVSDEKYMKEALGLATKGLGRTSPNPAVGCIIVKGGRVVGRGWHKKAGGAHAEIEALKGAGKRARGATMYVTLEPCCHQGRTGPCTKAIIEANISKVVAAMSDPNEIVCGRGCEELKLAGIEVKTGVLEEEARQLNEAFGKYITTKTPFVLVKVAISADGMMAAADGSRVHITGRESQRVVHNLRNVYDVIVVGANTVIKDDPLLTARIPGGRNPVRVVVDAKLKIPLNSRVFNKEAKTIVATTKKAPKKKVNALRKKGVEVIAIKEVRGGVDLRALMKALGGRGMMSVMIEGGPTLIRSAFEAGIVDKVMLFIAPKIIGRGKRVDGDEQRNIKDAVQLEQVEASAVGSDLLLTGYVKAKA